MSIQEEHEAMVKNLAKPGEKIKEELSAADLEKLIYLLNACRYIADVLDKTKKALIYRKAIDLPTLLESVEKIQHLLKSFRECYTVQSHRVSSIAKEALESITPEQCHMLHMVIGIFGEAGEIVDHAVDHIIYNAPIDKENILEEDGDLSFYVVANRLIHKITLEESLNHNLNKLIKGRNARYKEGTYSDQAAQERRDKFVVQDPTTDFVKPNNIG